MANRRDRPEENRRIARKSLDEGFKKKILVVIPAYIPVWLYGGAVFALHRLFQEMVSQGDDMTVYTTDSGLPSDD